MSDETKNKDEIDWIAVIIGAIGGFLGYRSAGWGGAILGFFVGIGVYLICTTILDKAGL